MTLGALQQVLTDFDLTHSAVPLSNHMVSKSELWLHSHMIDDSTSFQHTCVNFNLLWLMLGMLHSDVILNLAQAF